MTQKLSVQGPFRVPYTISPARIKCIDTVHAKSFWSNPEVAGLGSKHGVYVFALKAAKGFTPIYVGKSTTGFKNETFQPQKLHHYGQALAQGSKGTPVLFFVAPDGAARKVPRKVCDEIETFFIQLAIRKNPRLRNDKKTKLAEWTVKGVVRSGKGKRSEKDRAFCMMIGKA